MKLRIACPFLLAFLAAGEAAAANGCPPGSVSITKSPDGKATSVLFDQFSVEAGGGTGTTRATCALSVPVALKPGRVGVYRADYRGFAHVGAGQAASLAVTAPGKTTNLAIAGPSDGDFRHFDRLGGGLDGSVDARLVLTVRTAADLDAALAVLDSLDMIELGTTSVASVRASMDDVAGARTAAGIHLATTADMLLGFAAPLDAPTGASAIAAAGSATVGAGGRMNLDGGFTLLGGAAYVSLSEGGATVDGSALFAGAVRWLDPAAQPLRPFVEAGVTGSPDLALRFSRDYENGTGTGDTSGTLVGVYGRAGVLYAPNPANQIVLSATLARNWLSVDGYREDAGPGNLFPATFRDGTTETDIATAGVAWTTAVTPRFDVTLSGAVGRAFADGSGVAADVDWVGRVTGKAEDVTFLEYGARVGYRLTPTLTLDALVFGTTGDGIGSEVQVGGGLRATF